MQRRYTIGELARSVGVPTSTVRYYERRGLLTAGARSASNYRIFDDDELDKLRFIKASQVAGFALSDIRALLNLRDTGEAPNREVQELIADRLRKIAEQQEHLREADEVLRRWMDACREAERCGRCEVIEGLSTSRTEPCDGDNRTKSKKTRRSP